MRYNTLKEMKAALENDPEIRIIGVKEKASEIFNAHEYGRTNHEVTFYITLKQDTYDPKVLTRWLLKYDPERNLNFDAFELDSEYLHLTTLFFREVIGEVVVNKELKFTGADIVSSLGLKDGTKSLQSIAKLERGVVVRLFPQYSFCKTCNE